MPKKSSKGSKGTPKRGLPGLRRGGASDEDSVNGDTASVVSMASDHGSYDEGLENGNCGGDEVDVTSSRETLEEKISASIEGMTEKSAGIRSTSINNLINILSQQYIPDSINSRRETLRDNIERILKRGARADQALVAGLSSIFALQIGSIDLDLATEDFNELKPLLQTIMMDFTAPIPVRVKSCYALCLGLFLAESTMEDLCATLVQLETLFVVNNPTPHLEVKEDTTASPFKALTPAKTPKVTCESVAAAAVSGWSLLITVMPKEYLKQKANRWLRVLKNLLDQAELEVRLNAGEAVALLVEACELDEDESASGSEDETSVNGHGSLEMRNLISKLRELSVQSHKYQAKKDRRQQKHNFRDYLRAVEDGDGPDQTVKFGHGEVLEIETWVKKRQYDAICQVLSAGINRHLVENTLVREILGLGAPRPIQSDALNNKQAKAEKQFQNQLNFKFRSVNRGKCRDQRMATLDDY